MPKRVEMGTRTGQIEEIDVVRNSRGVAQLVRIKIREDWFFVDGHSAKLADSWFSRKHQDKSNTSVAFELKSRRLTGWE